MDDLEKREVISYIDTALYYYTGIIFIFPSNNIPTGFLLCDGSEISRTQYKHLFKIIGTTFGYGDGLTTFNLPNLKQRFVVGKSDSGTGSILGERGGSIDHTHTIDPPNTTSTSNGDHTHTGTTGGPSSTSTTTNLVATVASNNHTHDFTTDSSGAHTHDINIASFNSGTNNPPYISLNYIIKT